MRIVIHKWLGRLHIYREDEKHHAVIEGKGRDGCKKIDWPFDDDCDLSYFPDDSYVVVKVKKKGFNL